MIAHYTSGDQRQQQDCSWALSYFAVMGSCTSYIILYPSWKRQAILISKFQRAKDGAGWAEGSPARPHSGRCHRPGRKSSCSHGVYKPVEWSRQSNWASGWQWWPVGGKSYELTFYRLAWQHQTVVLFQFSKGISFGHLFSGLIPLTCSVCWFTVNFSIDLSWAWKRWPHTTNFPKPPKQLWLCNTSLWQGH